MDATVQNVKVGNKVIYNDRFNKDQEYLIVYMKLVETLDEVNNDISIKATLTGKYIQDNGEVRYNNFYSLSNGTFPYLKL